MQVFQVKQPTPVQVLDKIVATNDKWLFVYLMILVIMNNNRYTNKEDFTVRVLHIDNTSDIFQSRHQQVDRLYS